MKNIIRKTNKSILLLLVLAFILTACQLHKFTPQEVIKNTLQSDDRVAYYGELNITMIENDDEEIMSMKEWRDSELGRVELVTKEEHVVSIINDETVLSYSDQEKTAYLVNGEKESELFVHPREGLNTMLKNLHDTHDIKMSGDSKIANRKVF